MALKPPKSSGKNTKLKANKKLSVSFKAKKLFNWHVWRVLLLLCLWMLFFGFLTIAYFAKDLPDLEEFAKKDYKPVITITDQDGYILAKYGDIHGKTLTYSQFPSTLIDAVLAAEDHRFFNHFGLDVIGIARAYFTNIKAGRVVQGGSTITQQLSKIAYLSPERTFKRKIQEVMIALQLESKFSKEQILSMYLNRVYMGKGVYGVDAAARFYFDKDVGDLTLFESAILAGMLKAPSRYSPANSPVNAVGRAKVVLERMVSEGFITSGEAKRAVPPEVVQHGLARGVLRNPYFTDYILNEISDYLEVANQDLVIKTTLDIKLQNNLENAVIANMQQASEKYGVSQAAGLSIEPNGAIKAMVGGLSYAKSSYNRAVSAKRQSGSAFKFFVYAAAMEQGFSPYDTFDDKPLKIAQGRGLPLWSPKNFDRKFRGEMPLIDAFAQSINTIAVQLSEEVGRENVIALAKDMGVKGDMPNYPSIALGVTDVSLMEMTQSFAVIANHGHFVKPFAILEIQLKDGTTIYKYPAHNYPKVLPDSALANMRILLKAVVEEGTGRGSRIPGITSYGKTGTTQDHKDAWFIGFTDDLVTGVWVGNDDNSPMKNLVGGGLPTHIWKDYMSVSKEFQKTNIKQDGDIFDRLFS